MTPISASRAPTIARVLYSFTLGFLGRRREIFGASKA
jgi:hypothetical protein